MPTYGRLQLVGSHFRSFPNSDSFLESGCEKQHQFFTSGALSTLRVPTIFGYNSWQISLSRPFWVKKSLLCSTPLNRFMLPANEVLTLFSCSLKRELSGLQGILWPISEAFPTFSPYFFLFQEYTSSVVVLRFTYISLFCGFMDLHVFSMNKSVGK